MRIDRYSMARDRFFFLPLRIYTRELQILVYAMPYISILFPPFFFSSYVRDSADLSRYETPIAYFGNGTDTAAFKRYVNSNETRYDSINTIY